MLRSSHIGHRTVRLLAALLTSLFLVGAGATVSHTSVYADGNCSSNCPL